MGSVSACVNGVFAIPKAITFTTPSLVRNRLFGMGSVSACVNGVFAIPKAITFTTPSLVRNRLFGFTSRWTMPRSWAA
jgi:hypothetical protein